MMAMCRKMIPTMGVVKVNPGSWVWSEEERWPPLQRVLAAPFWTLSVHEDIRNTLARPVVEPKLSASDAKFTTITSDRNFGQVDADVVSEATATGVCHIIPMAPGSPLPSGVTNLPYQAVFLEVPPAYFSGIHSFVTSLVSRNVPLVVAGPCAEVKAVCDTLRGEEVSQSLSIFDIIYFTSTGAAGRYTHVQYSIVLICLNCPHGLKIPRYVTTYGTTLLRSSVFPEFAGWFLSAFDIVVTEEERGAPCPWLCVVTTQPELPPQLIIRMQCDFNVTVGYLDENMSEDFPHMIMAGMTKADGMMRIFWDEAISDLVSGRPVDLSGEAYIPESEEVGGGGRCARTGGGNPPKTEDYKA